MSRAFLRADAINEDLYLQLNDFQTLVMVLTLFTLLTLAFSSFLRSVIAASDVP